MMPIDSSDRRRGLRSTPTTSRAALAPHGTTLLDLIGNTPLLSLARLGRSQPGVEIYAKAEWQNPGGSGKDRPAVRMIAEGERQGRLVPGKIILDATSGNTGIAYAMIGAAKGYLVTLCVPRNISRERREILRAYGADLVYTDPLAGSDGAIREARRLHAENPSTYFYPDQYANDANWQAHYETTGPEIIAQTEERITHFVAGLGTSGTFMGVGRRLRELGQAQGRHIQLVSFQPDSPLHGVEGLKHMDSAIVPAIYDPDLADEDLRVSTEEAHALVRRLALEEGILAGISSGAALAVCLRIAERFTEGVVVTVFPDRGERYLSERFWEEPIAHPHTVIP